MLNLKKAFVMFIFTYILLLYNLIYNIRRKEEYNLFLGHVIFNGIKWRTEKYISIPIYFAFVISIYSS